MASYGLPTAAKNALIAWVNAILAPVSIKAVWADQDAPEGSTTYITLRPAAFVKIGDDVELPPDDEGIADMVGNREFTLFMQAIGPGALDALQSLQASLDRTSVRDALELGGLVFYRTEDVENLTGLIGQNNNERGALDVFFRQAFVQEENTGVIAEAGFGGEISRAVGDPDPIEVNFTVDSTPE